MRQTILGLIVILLLNLAPKISYGYTEYLKVTPSSSDKTAIENTAKKESITDNFGQTYTVTKNGLLISAAKESKEKKYSWPASFVRRIVHIIESIASFIGWDSLSNFAKKFIKGDNGNILMNGEDGLPYESLTSIDIDQNGDILLGSTHGLILLSRGKFLYFSGPRWLDNNEVAKAIFYNGNLLIQTKTGISKIKRFEFTLKEKERYFDKLMDKRFKRSTLELVGPRFHDQVTVTDNDGLWTSIYIASQSFKYAATKDKTAKKNATESINALIFLRKVTGLPGFFARTAVKKDEKIDWQNEDGEWHQSKIYPDWVWKGDTSFDELIGHFFAYGIYYDLVADEKEKKALREQVNAIADHLVANNFCLIDVDGKPTKWAQGNPDDTFRSLWHFFGRGPLSLGTLSVLKTAAHITERKDLEDLYNKLIIEYRYALNIYNAKVIDNYSDNELAFLSYFNLIRLEKNPELKSLYLISLNRYWQHVHQEKNPLWNFMYRALSNNSCNYNVAIKILEEIPLDLRRIKMQNSHRKDIKTKKTKDGLESQRVLSPRERGIMRWNNSPYLLDGGDWWREDEMEPSFWLLPYWLGKYYKFI